MKKTRIITECSVCIALAVVCSFIKVWEMPQGGSVSLTMVPLFVIAYRQGIVPGVVSGMVYGIISLMFAGAVYHPMSILLDYVLAFGILGIAGMFEKNIKGICIGTSIGVLGRFLSSLISGAVLFGSYAPEGQNPWVYSLIYQATYLIPEMIITLAFLILIYYKGKSIYNI